MIINPDFIKRFAEGAAPRILIVTDLSFTKEGKGGFSLARFIETLERQGAVIGTKPKVTKANTEPKYDRDGNENDPDSDIQDFKFDNAENGLTRERYDVCFIFAVRRDGSWFNFAQSSLPPNELNAIEEFMQAGGGVFATGDHEDLGAGICRDIIRVRNMRKWTAGQGVPSQTGIDRLSTNLSGDDELYEFNDQSDRHLQRLYLNRRTEAGGADMPHPLMQEKTSDGKNVAIVHIPDHPHEGECIIPDNLETVFTVNVTIDGQSRVRAISEWPVEQAGSQRVFPEIVAKSMSHGGGFLFLGRYKEYLTPREFIAIAAYDGHRAGVGRVVTDATWHHFIDINIDGTGSEETGEPRTALIPREDEVLKPGERELIAEQWNRLQQHWCNIAEWLIPPQDRRRHAAVVHIASAINSIPLDELNIPAPDQRTAESDKRLGEQIKMNLDRKLRPYQVNDLIETVLAMGIGDPVVRRTADKMAALGAFAAALAKQNAGDDDEVILANLAEAVKARLQQP